MARTTAERAKLAVPAIDAGDSENRHPHHRWDLFMVAAAIASLALVAWVELNDLDWPHPSFKKCALVDLAFVVFFLIEFAVRLWRAPSKRQFWRDNWYDLPGLVPMYVESFSWLRAFRLLRIVRVLRLLRLVQAIRRLRASVDFVNRVLSASRLGYTLSIAAMLVVAMSAGFWILEHGKNPSLRGYDDALWWAMSTATTVGYGDIAPQTGAGRLLASCLMLFGIGLVGVVASSLSAAIYHVGQQNQTSPTKAIEALIDNVEDLVVRRERGELTADDFERLKNNLVTIAKIKTE